MTPREIFGLPMGHVRRHVQTGVGGGVYISPPTFERRQGGPENDASRACTKVYLTGTHLLQSILWHVVTINVSKIKNETCVMFNFMSTPCKQKERGSHNFSSLRSPNYLLQI